MAALTSTTKASSMPARMTVRPVPATLALAAALLQGACQAPKSRNDNGLGRQEAAAIVDRYQAATNAEDAGQLAALYSADAFLLPPDGGVVQGQDQIHQFWSEGLERGLVMDTLRMVLDGDAGWVAGRYYLAGSDEAPPDSGKFVLALTHTDGAWRVAADIWNTTPSEMEAGESSDPRTRILSASHPARHPAPASRPLSLAAGHTFGR